MNSAEAENKMTKAIEIAEACLQKNKYPLDSESVSRLAAVIYKDLEI